MVGWVLFTFFH